VTRLIILLLILLILVSYPMACAPNPRYIYENGTIMVGGDGEPLELINNPSATNPTYEELVAFIEADATDTTAYVEEAYRVGGLEVKAYTCADFAEAVHNNAEVAGIRAAWVGLYFEGDDEGHALNAFETTDRGLVYVDCTGGNPGFLTPESISIALAELNGQAPSKPTSWDFIAYIEVGKEYGLIPIIKVKSTSYSFYEEYKRKWQEYEELVSDYNDDVTQYNQEISGKIYYERSPELARIAVWEARLREKGRAIDELSKELGDYWFEPLGIVKDIHIHWGNS
jgi:hypothetical protein